MPLLRTRFKKDIIAEFLIPPKSSSQVIILCDGMPSVPSKRAVMEFFCKKGYAVFYPRYRGSWESGGEFLERSPHEDILDILDQLPQGFTSLFDGKKFHLHPKKVYVVGSSFGGTAALLCSRDPRVTKVVAFSPVVDWKAPSKAEPLDWFYGVVKDAFGEAYRLRKKNWNKLKTGKFYNPINHLKEFDAKKILLIHAKDDEVVPFKSIDSFLKKVKPESVVLKKGGHLSLSLLLTPKFYKKVKKFFS